MNDIDRDSSLGRRRVLLISRKPAIKGRFRFYHERTGLWDYPTPAATGAFSYETGNRQVKMQNRGHGEGLCMVDTFRTTGASCYVGG